MKSDRNSDSWEQGPDRSGWSAAIFSSCKAESLLGALLVAALVGGIAGDAGATVLIFDQLRNSSGMVAPIVSAAGTIVPQDYGDRVTGSPIAVAGGDFTYGNSGEGFTPNVVAEYSSANRVALWPVGYGDLTNVMFATQDLGVAPAAMNVRLTADPGFEVLLYDFDLAGYPQADYTIDAVTVYGGVTPLFSQSNVLVEGNLTGPRHTSFAFATPLRGPELLIEIDFSNLALNVQDNIGIDNIRFGQDPPEAMPEEMPEEMPEPAALPFFLAALGALSFATWRKRRAT
jgi:hypothetical protein